MASFPASFRCHTAASRSCRCAMPSHLEGIRRSEPSSRRISGGSGRPRSAVPSASSRQTGMGHCTPSTKSLNGCPKWRGVSILWKPGERAHEDLRYPTNRSLDLRSGDRDVRADRPGFSHLPEAQCSGSAAGELCRRAPCGMQPFRRRVRPDVVVIAKCGAFPACSPCPRGGAGRAERARGGRSAAWTSAGRTHSPTRPLSARRDCGLDRLRQTARSSAMAIRSSH